MAADEWIGETETIINGKVSIGLNKAQSLQCHVIIKSVTDFIK